MENEMVAKQSDLTMEEIKNYICPEATDQEAYFFLQLCKAQGLNPFLREAYLIKYGKEKATIVTGKDTFTKRADRLPQYDGFKAGIIVLSNNQVTYREGSFMVQGESLLGGWAEVFRKDRSQPFRNEVSLVEYERHKQDGTLMHNWKSMPATMIRKVALVQSLREAFPEDLGGIYSPEEMPIDTAALPTYTQGQSPIIPPPTTDKPPIQEPKKKNGKAQEPATSITVAVEQVEVKTGKYKDIVDPKTKKPIEGKPWTLYIVHTGGDKYNTFSETFGKLAQKSFDEKLNAVISFSVTDKGKKLENITLEEGPPDDTAQG